MSLAHAIMGVLSLQPVTGYDLKTRWFDRALRYFWAADQAQIYRTLDKMTEAGWAVSHIEPGTDRPNRKVYELTDAGHAELNRWLATPQPQPTNRDPLLVQLFFGARLPDETLIRLLEEQVPPHQERLALYRGILTEGSRSDIISPRQWRLIELTLAQGIRLEQAYLDWIADAIATLHAGIDRDEPR
jgi:PadR family transcriptional regulator, regulatory protein AphA